MTPTLTVTLALAALAVFIGAALQSATGFGFALVAAPVLFALLGPREAVTAGVVLALALNALTLASERRRPVVMGREVLLLVGWSLPGLAIGVVALRELPERTLSAFVALAVLAGLGLRLRSRSRRGRRRAAGRAERRRAWQAPAAGLASGALATSTSLSGPPLVFHLLTRNVTAGAMRDTLAAIFVAQALLSLPALLASDTFAAPEGIWVLLGVGAAGQLLGRRAFGWLQGERYERAVLGVLALSALVALAAGVL